MFSSLGSPDWNNGVEDAGTEAVDQTSADHPIGILSRALQRGTNDSPASTKRDCLYTAKLITEPTTNETADQSTDIVDRDLVDVSNDLTIPQIRFLQFLPGAECYQ